MLWTSTFTSLTPVSPTFSPFFAATLEMVEERPGLVATLDKSGEVAERDGAMLRLKKGGAFYAPSPLECVAVHWPLLVAGTAMGELYHLKVDEE